MTVTLITRRQARPGQEDALLAVAERRLADERRLYRAQSVQLFQGRDDPGLLLRVTIWESREAFERRPGSRDVDQLDELCVGPPERYFCNWLSFYRVVTSQPALVTCTVLEAPEAASDRLAALLREIAGAVRGGLPDLVLHGLYQDQDAACRFIALGGWQSPEAWDQAQRGMIGHYQADLRAMGAAITRFVAVRRVQVERRRS